MGGQLPDVAGAVPAADRRALAGVEDGASGGGGGAGGAQGEGVGDVAGAVGRGGCADGVGLVERWELYVCGRSDDLKVGWMGFGFRS